MYVSTLPAVLLIAFGLVASGEAKSSRSERMIRPPCWRRPWINTTAAGLYNFETEKCCLGSVHPNKKPAYAKCCGSNVMDSTKEMCCNNAVVPLVPGESCCGQKTFNTDNAICCEGEEVKVDSEAVSSSQCCGKVAYNIDKETCCTNYDNGNAVYSILPISGTKTSCCGDQVYDAKTDTCCGGKVAPIGSGCCANTPYNTTMHVCCNDQLTETNGKNMDCCEKEAFDTDAQVCCTGYSADGSLSAKLVTKTESNQTICCNMEPYDFEKQFCCPATQKVLTKTDPMDYVCCGDATYNYYSGLCCDDVLYPNVTSMSHECCAGQPMDRSQSSCCGNQIIGLLSFKGCCGSETYDTERELCCTVYNSTTGAVENSVIPNPERKLSCCGLKSFDQENELCCMDEAQANPEEKLSCCGAKTYDQEKELCCGEDVIANPEKKLFCCGLKTYDMEKELCCGEEVIAKSGNNLCCGSQSYDMDKEVCCSGTTVFPKEDGRETCCLYGTTDAERQFPLYRYNYHCYDYAL